MRVSLETSLGDSFTSQHLRLLHCLYHIHYFHISSSLHILLAWSHLSSPVAWPCLDTNILTVTVSISPPAQPPASTTTLRLLSFPRLPTTHHRHRLWRRQTLAPPDFGATRLWRLQTLDGATRLWRHQTMAPPDSCATRLWRHQTLGKT